ncbi:hypothetical protein PMT_1919 [Prochlorococcus marinus str. MIT 9313]|uniref:Glycosyltransferase RgtA/B/C/D-like domain-containing protein n=2 Tax=Prochlorococcus marinus TaxID=1219 RepID=Q7V4N0_PROMM|nr:hypothetical protein PMT_1919 [Prochlorococcus marinus str. MIT 9313]
MSKSKHPLIVWMASFFAALLTLAFVAHQWVEANRDLWPNPRSEEGLAITLNYNIVSHALFLLALAAILAWLLNQTRQKASRDPHSSRGKPLKRQRAWKAVSQHPFATVIFTACAIFMVSEASWFYKEIIGWFDDIQAGYLLDNFSLRMNLFRETMSRNDFRFYPLAFQDLQILSWLTPYPKIWMIFNVAQMIATVILGAKIADLTVKHKQGREAIAMFAILFIFIAPSAYSYFQFIYSERIVTLLFAGHLYAYINYKLKKQILSRNAAIACALIGIFFKDTAILLFLSPAAVTLALGNIGLVTNMPKPSETSFKGWISAYKAELAIMSLALFFIICFAYLSYLPSLYVGGDRYDAELKFVRFVPDLRLFILSIYTAIRSFQILKKKETPNPVDGANFGALAYVFALYYFVGYRSSNYMALPMHFVAVIDILIAWQSCIKPWLEKRIGPNKTSFAGTFLSVAIIYGEHMFPNTFYHRIKDMTMTQRSWAATYKKSDEILRAARETGQPVNVIFSKSWFRRFSHLKQLKYDRLIYLNEDTKEYLIVDGVGKGGFHQPQIGDFFLDLDTGRHRIKEFGINIDGFVPIYEYAENLKNGRIYIKR